VRSQGHAGKNLYVRALGEVLMSGEKFSWRWLVPVPARVGGQFHPPCCPWFRREHVYRNVPLPLPDSDGGGGYSSGPVE